MKLTDIENKIAGASKRNLIKNNTNKDLRHIQIIDESCDTYQSDDSASRQMMDLSILPGECIDP